MKKFIILSILLMVAPIAHTQDVISQIRFVGLNATAQNDALNAIGLRPGEVLTSARLNFAIKDLYAMQRFKNISVDITNTVDGAVITFTVEEEALIDKVSFEGLTSFQISKARKEISITSGSAYREASVNRAVFDLTEFYKKEGYLEVKVSYKVEPIKQLPGQYDLTFEISLGQKISVQQIIITGNESFKARKLTGIMQTKTKMWIFRSGLLDPMAFAQDENALIGFYQENGYMDVKINSFKWDIENIDTTNSAGVITKTTRGIVVRIDLTEGPQYTVGKFTFGGNLIFPTAELRKFIDLKEGDVYNKTKIEMGRAQIYKMYADRGYLFANVSAIEEKSADHVINTEFVIFEGQRAHIENVTIRGNTKTLPSVIRRYIQIKEGEIYVNSKMEQSYNRLMQTQFFSDVRINPSPGSGEGLVNIDFQVMEQNTGMIEFLVGYGTVSGFSAGIKLSERNLFGRGYTVSLRAEWGQYTQLGEISFTDPYIFNTPFSLSFIMGVYHYTYTDIPTDENHDGIIDGTSFDWINNEYSTLSSFSSDYQYNRLSFRAGLAVGLQFAVYWNASVGYDLNIFKDYDANFTNPLIYDGKWEIDDSLIDSLAFGWTIQSTVNLALRFNNTDGGLWPTKGISTALFVSLSGGALGGDIDFTNITYSFDYYWNVFWRWTMVFHFDTSVLLPQIGGKFNYRDANMLSFDGVYKMRGWLNYVPKGEGSMYFSIEQRVPVWEFVGLVAFWDYGAIYPSYQDYSFDQTYYIMSFGVGLAINLPILPIRLYAARPVEWQQGSGFKLANNDSFWRGWEFVFSIQGLF